MPTFPRFWQPPCHISSTHNKLKLRLAEIIRSAFIHKNGQSPDINYWYYILWATILLMINPIPTLK